MGLGLFIAARLAETIGGSIGVATTDETVTFTLRFPVHGVTAPTAGARTARRSAARRGTSPRRRS
jgi:nitrogen-specific signal transduction histidine kinase